MKYFLNLNLQLLCIGFLAAFLFFPSGLGLNLFLFDAVLVLSLLALNPAAGRRPFVQSGILLVLATAVSTVIVGSAISLVAHHVSLLLLAGYVQRRELRFVWYALLLGAATALSSPFAAGLRLLPAALIRDHAQRLTRWGLPAILALLLSLPFFILYAGSELRFLDMFAGVLDGIFGWFTADLVRIALLVALGCCVAAMLLLPQRLVRLPLAEREQPDQLRRVRGAGRRLGYSALRGRIRTALLLLGALNGLLALFNLSDLRFVWLAVQPAAAADLSRYVHAGTNNLLVSLLLAMVVVVVIFRGNLNFFRGAAPLRRLTYLWLAQNAFLVISVAFRNLRYILEYGLTHRRILVAFGLLLILTGLYSLYRKVRYRKSLRYLLQVNGLALWLFVVAAGAVNWSVLITRVNLWYPDDRIDWSYLTRDLYPANRFLLRREGRRVPTNASGEPAGEEPRTDWRTWTYADWRNAHFYRDDAQVQ